MVRQPRSVGVKIGLRVHIGRLVAVVVVSNDKAEAETENQEEACVGSHAGCQWFSDDKFSHIAPFIANCIREQQGNAYSLHKMQAERWKPLEEADGLFLLSKTAVFNNIQINQHSIKIDHI